MKQHPMLKKLLQGPLVAMLLMLGYSATAVAAAVAMVTDFKGKGVIVESGTERPCTILSYLSPGAEIRMESGAHLVMVYLSSAKEYAFTDATTLRIAEAGPEVVSGQRSKSRDLDFPAGKGLSPAGKAGYSQAAVALRGAGKKKRVQLISPRNTRILKQRPGFRWHAVEAGLQYRFVLMDESGQTLTETLLNDTKFTLPKGVTLKANEYYTWQVETRTAKGQVYSSSADFSLVSGKTRDKINGERPASNASFTDRVVFAAYLDQEEFHDDAAHYWMQLAKERPNHPALEQRAKNR